MMASAPSLSEERTTSFRVSLARTGEGPDAAWLAEFEELPNVSGRGATPEEAVRRAWAALGQGGWTGAGRLARWAATVAGEGLWQPHRHGG